MYDLEIRDAGLHHHHRKSHTAEAEALTLMEPHQCGPGASRLFSGPKASYHLTSKAFDCPAGPLCICHLAPTIQSPCVSEMFKAIFLLLYVHLKGQGTLKEHPLCLAPGLLNFT